MALRHQSYGLGAPQGANSNHRAKSPGARGHFPLLLCLAEHWPRCSAHQEWHKTQCNSRQARWAAAIIWPWMALSGAIDSDEGRIRSLRWWMKHTPMFHLQYLNQHFGFAWLWICINVSHTCILQLIQREMHNLPIVCILTKSFEECLFPEGVLLIRCYLSSILIN